NNGESLRISMRKENVTKYLLKMMPPFCNTQQSSGVVRDADGQIIPKKIINPCLDSIDRQNLHRELMFNQKIGRNVLDQKSELEKVLRKQKEKQRMSNEQKSNQGIRSI
ncbi:hypothetical protein Bhyg_12937, partial [Pseudolycoriella hygida]